MLPHCLQTQSPHPGFRLRTLSALEVAAGSDRGGEGQEPPNRPDEITSPEEGGGERRVLPASLATPAASSELIPHTPC